jgi:hypothetical protein
MTASTTEQNRDAILDHIRETMGFDPNQSIRIHTYLPRAGQFTVEVEGVNLLLNQPMKKHWSLPVEKRVLFVNALSSETVVLDPGW